MSKNQRIEDLCLELQKSIDSKAKIATQQYRVTYPVGVHQVTSTMAYQAGYYQSLLQGLLQQLDLSDTQMEVLEKRISYHTTPKQLELDL